MRKIQMKIKKQRTFMRKKLYTDFFFQIFPIIVIRFKQKRSEMEAPNLCLFNIYKKQTPNYKKKKKTLCRKTLENLAIY